MGRVECGGLVCVFPRLVDCVLESAKYVGRYWERHRPLSCDGLCLALSGYADLIGLTSVFGVRV